MAAPGNVEAMLNGVADGETARILKAAFKYILKNMRFGRATTASTSALSAAASENFSGGFFQGTTPAIANTEFSIVHRFGRPPYLLIPVLPLDQVDAAIVRLTVSRAADVDNLYLKSPDTEQPIFVYLEG